MRRIVCLIAIFAAPFAFATTGAAQSESQVKQRLIRQSIANYPGNCPCPYSVDRAGRSCSRRSGYYRPGAAPLCYARDVTPEMVRAAQAGRQSD